VVVVVEDAVNTSSVLNVEVVPRTVRLFVDAKVGVDVMLVDEGGKKKTSSTSEIHDAYF